MRFKRSILAKSSCMFIASAIFGNCLASSVPSVKVTSNSEELMSALFSDKVTTKNVKVVGNPKQIGVFSSSKNLLGLDSGVVLSTGFASETFKVQGKPSPDGYGYHGNLPVLGAEGPEEDLPDMTGEDEDYQFGEDGPTDTQKTEDKDVEKAAGNKHSYDSVALEFDIVPQTDEITLQYVYASSEWQRVFNQGAPVVGDGVGGVEPGGQDANYAAPDDTAVVMVNGKNVAKVPSTRAVLSAKNILEASGYDTSKPGPEPETGKFVSKGLFVDATREENFGFLGRSKMMQVTATVTPNEVNHVKIAVSDLEDPFYNTALFIRLTLGDNIEEEETVEENEEENQDVVNPQTGDINLAVIVASALASTTGLSVLIKKSRKK